ncbi:MAG: hypothetical protein FD163_1969 [Hyphomonadaceae bacterium]|nr:MAG: hypothetical protein FD163_1969 [Hyphomonadaceae bacterium]
MSGLFSQIHFAHLGALFALAAIPLIWLVSKMIPPSPRTMALPTFKFLADLGSVSRNIQAAPIWLKILRSLALFCLIAAIATPYYSAGNGVKTTAEAVTIVIDDSWANANDWEQIRANSKAIIENHAPINNATTQFRLMTSSQNAQMPISVLSNRDTLNFTEQLEPKPYLPDHRALTNRLKKLDQKSHIYYFTDGLRHDASDEFIGELKRIAIGKPNLLKPNSPLVTLNNIEATENGFAFEYKSFAKNAREKVNFLSKDGEILGTGQGENGRGSLALPANLVRKTAAASIAGQYNAGAHFMIAASVLPPLIGIEGLGQADEPLVSDNHYIATAANMIGNVVQGDVDNLIAAKPNAIIFGDRNGFSPSEERALLAYMRHGGTIIRFMGAHAVGKQQDLIVCAPLSATPRIMASNFSWNGARIEPTPPLSPLFGVEINEEARPRIVSVFQNAQSNVEIWARLMDQTPLVSRRAIGLGQIVMIHTSASPVWSDISLYDSQIHILRRILQTSMANGISANTRPPSGEMRPILLLNGFGEIGQVSADQKPILPNQLVSAPNADYPPGIYAGNGSVHVLQAASSDLALRRLDYKAQDFDLVSGFAKSQVDLRQTLFFIGFLALAVDCLIAALGLAFFRKSSNKFAEMATILLCLFVFSPLLATSTPAIAQSTAAPKASAKMSDDDLVLAYIITPDAATNLAAKTGLEGLSAALNARTNIRTTRIIGISPASDEMALYPIIYWLLPANNRPMDAASAQALNRYMRNGGVLFIDTKGGGRERRIALQNTQIATRGLVLPPLEPPPENHVLHRSFYLLAGFPGRFANSNLWVEAQNSTNISANDGVSPIIIGDGDWASAWAGGPHGREQTAIELGLIFIFMR